MEASRIYDASRPRPAGSHTIRRSRASKNLRGQVFGETPHDQEVSIVFSAVAPARQDSCYVSELILDEVRAGAEPGLRSA